MGISRSRTKVLLISYIIFYIIIETNYVGRFHNNKYTLGSIRMSRKTWTLDLNINRHLCNWSRPISARTNINLHLKINIELLTWRFRNHYEYLHLKSFKSKVNTMLVNMQTLTRVVTLYAIIKHVWKAMKLFSFVKN